MRLLFIWFFFIGLNPAFATVVQKPGAKQITTPKIKQNLNNDSSKFELRNFDEQKINKCAKQKEFIYDDIVPENQTLWQRFWAWVWRSINQIMSNKIGGNIIKFVLVGLVIAIIVFVIVKLVGIDFKFFSGKSKAVEVPFEENLENIHEINFDEQIEKATQENNYRLVVRLLYLKTLKHLNDKHLITWLPEKTNQTYVLEIENKTNQQEFALLTNQFEYIWYGEFFIDKSSFTSIQLAFEQFNQQTA